MSSNLIKQEGSLVTYEVSFAMSGSMLNMEEQIQNAVNELGLAATATALSNFDTNGGPVAVNSVPYSAKKVKQKKK